MFKILLSSFLFSCAHLMQVFLFETMLKSFNYGRKCHLYWCFVLGFCSNFVGSESGESGPFLLSTQAFLCLLAGSLLLSLAGRPCFFKAPVTAVNVAAPLHKKLSSSSPPVVSKHSLAHVHLATQSLHNLRRRTAGGEGPVETAGGG